MSRQALNNALARTSFLHGVNSGYIEEMQAQYARNPGSVSDEWRLFFESLHEEHEDGSNTVSGPSWAKPLEQIESYGNSDLVAALTSDYSRTEEHLRERISARANQGGFDLSMAASLRATQ